MEVQHVPWWEKRSSSGANSLSLRVRKCESPAPGRGKNFVGKTELDSLLHQRLKEFFKDTTDMLETACGNKCTSVIFFGNV